MTRAIVLDIEGTTSPTDAVRTDLYGYTSARLPAWLAENADGAADSVIAATRELAGEPDADTDRIAEILRGWLESDVKAEPLKTAQGAICAQGFRTGALHGRFFADVAPALAKWHDAGFQLHVYSSGSERNQRDWFTFADSGDLSGLITDHFDLVTAGPKREPTSYQHIAERIDIPGPEILFLSDHPDELDAATTAGWQVVGIHRDGEPNSPRAPHVWVGSFDEITVRTPA
ncbi:acireductone synthase [Nocardia sp. NPDC058176]|uniref:acireductone synthase n=1 Tax=Nocardia sp. NPDC058176 TaxID=3346368 RepID=UPI0036D9D4AA